MNKFPPPPTFLFRDTSKWSKEMLLRHIKSANPPSLEDIVKFHKELKVLKRQNIKIIY